MITKSDIMIWLVKSLIVNSFEINLLQILTMACNFHNVCQDRERWCLHGMHSLQTWNLREHWKILYNILSISLVSNLTEATPRDCGSGARGFRHSTDRLWEEIIIITTETNEKHQFWLVQLPSWLIGNRPVTIGASKIMSTGSITLPHSLCSPNSFFLRSRARFARPIFSTLAMSLFAG